MKTAPISQVKNKLNALIDQVRRGETIVITDRRWPVAMLAPAQAGNGEEAARVLEQLEFKGIIRRGNGYSLPLAPPLKLRSGARALAALLEHRESDR